MSMLHASVTAGEYGPLIVLSGIADVTTAATLTGVLSRQLADGTRRLLIDVSGLRGADSSSIWLLWLVARTLADGGGSLVLIRPQPAVAGALAQVDPGHVITISEEWRPGPEPEDLGHARLNPGRFGGGRGQAEHAHSPGRNGKKAEQS